MPHLSQLQQRHAADGLTVIASTRPDANNTLDAVRAMTAAKQDIMRFPVAFDGDGATYAAYMDASTPPRMARGIPAAFLIDGEGRLAWTGHPSTVDVPLAMVLAGAWDPVEGPGQLRAAMKDLSDMWRYSGGGLNEEHLATLRGRLEAFEGKWPQFVGPLRNTLYALYLSAEDDEKCATLGDAWLAQARDRKDAAGLNELAWTLVDPESNFRSRNLKLAFQAASAAVQLTEGKDAAVLDTLARVHAWQGEWKKAIEIQEKAVAVAQETGQDENLLNSLLDALDEYREGAEEPS
jgi:hypothetical protein